MMMKVMMMMILCVCPSLASEKVFLAHMLCDNKDNKVMGISSSWYSLTVLQYGVW